MQAVPLCISVRHHIKWPHYILDLNKSHCACMLLLQCLPVWAPETLSKLLAAHAGLTCMLALNIAHKPCASTCMAHAEAHFLYWDAARVKIYLGG